MAADEDEDDDEEEDEADDEEDDDDGGNESKSEEEDEEDDEDDVVERSEGEGVTVPSAATSCPSILFTSTIIYATTQPHCETRKLVLHSG